MLLRTFPTISDLWCCYCEQTKVIVRSFVGSLPVVLLALMHVQHFFVAFPSRSLMNFPKHLFYMLIANFERRLSLKGGKVKAHE